jgi:hypothetical protein
LPAKLERLDVVRREIYRELFPERRAAVVRAAGLECGHVATRGVHRAPAVDLIVAEHRRQGVGDPERPRVLRALAALVGLDPAPPNAGGLARVEGLDGFTIAVAAHAIANPEPLAAAVDPCRQLTHFQSPSA